MTVLEEQPVQEEVKMVPLQLRPNKNVQWTEDTIDNEHMNKRKSKSKFERFFDTWTNEVPRKEIATICSAESRGPYTRSISSYICLILSPFSMLHL